MAADYGLRRFRADANGNDHRNVFLITSILVAMRIHEISLIDRLGDDKIADEPYRIKKRSEKEQISHDTVNKRRNPSKHELSLLRHRAQKIDVEGESC